MVKVSCARTFRNGELAVPDGPAPEGVEQVDGGEDRFRHQLTVNHDLDTIL